MTAADLRALIDRRGWTQSQAADALGVRQPRISEWTAGKRPIPPYIAKLVECLARD